MSCFTLFQSFVEVMHWCCWFGGGTSNSLSRSVSPLSFYSFSFDASESRGEVEDFDSSASFSTSAIFCTEFLKSQFSASCRAATSATHLQRSLTTNGNFRTHVFTGLPMCGHDWRLLHKIFFAIYVKSKLFFLQLI